MKLIATIAILSIALNLYQFYRLRWTEDVRSRHTKYRETLEMVVNAYLRVRGKECK